MPDHGESLDRLRVDPLGYHRIRDFSARVWTEIILDVGLHDQRTFLEPADRANYRFVLSGLMPSERCELDALSEDDNERTIPWPFVGHVRGAEHPEPRHDARQGLPGVQGHPAAGPHVEWGSRGL